MTNPNEPDRLAELAAMRALAEQGIRSRSSRQVRNGAFPDLPWVGDPPVDEGQLRLFGDDQ